MKSYNLVFLLSIFHPLVKASQKKKYKALKNLSCLMLLIEFLSYGNVAHTMHQTYLKLHSIRYEKLQVS